MKPYLWTLISLFAFIHLHSEEVNLLETGAELGLQLGRDTYSVVLDPRQKTEIYAEVTSPVRIVFKKMGDTFQKGEVLIQLEDRVARGNLHKATVKWEKASTVLEGTKQLYKEKLASLFELKEAEADEAEAEADVILAERNARATVIIAPYNGIVTDIKVEEHELSQSGQELIRVIDDNALVAKLLVPSSLLKKIHVGSHLTIEIAETGDSVQGIITRFGGMIDPASSTIQVEAEIDNKERRYKAGMSGLAKFEF